MAIYWIAHYRQFHYIKHPNRRLIWINIIFLMATCLLPFSTSLLGEYREQQISILVYGANSIIIASLIYIQWWYATSHHGTLVDENLDPIVKTTSSKRLLFGIIVYLIAIGISFFVYSTKYVSFRYNFNTCLFLPNKMMHRITFGRSHEKMT